MNFIIFIKYDFYCREWTGEYTTDFRSLLPGGENYKAVPDILEQTTDVSLISGGMRSMGVKDNEPDSGQQVAVRETNTALSTVGAKSAGKRLLLHQT